MGRALALAIAVGAMALFPFAWPVSLLLIVVALAIVASGWNPPHWSEKRGARGRAKEGAGSHP